MGWIKWLIKNQPLVMYLVFGTGAVSFTSKKQDVSLSSIEAEYRAATKRPCEAVSLTRILGDLMFGKTKATNLFL